MGISQYRLAMEIGVPAQRIGEMSPAARITADTDLRLCRFFGLSTATGCAPRPATSPKSRTRASAPAAEDRAVVRHGSAKRPRPLAGLSPPQTHARSSGLVTPRPPLFSTCV